MGCFCQMSRTALGAILPQLNEQASVMLGAGVPLGLSAYLGAAGLPAEPWQPMAGWLSALPPLSLSLRTSAAISALAQLQAQAMAQFGLNLMIPAQAQAFARIVATMNAQLSAMAQASASFNPLGWIQLGTLNAAIDQVNLAIKLGLLPPGPEMLLALNLPGGMPMPNWRALLAYLRAMLPVVAACLQLNIPMEAAALSAAIRPLLQVQLPALAMPELMASLTAALNAVASLQASLGVMPLQLGLPAMQALVQAKLTVLLQSLPGLFRIQVPSLAQLLAALMALLPQLPLVPTSFATAASMELALSASVSALASLSWQVNVMPPSVMIGLPTVALTASLQASLGLNAVAKVPCPMGCQANAVLSAAMSAA
jgi:hypothetical protein